MDAVWGRPQEPVDEGAFWRQRQDEGARNWVRTTFAALAAILIWWPTDFMTFRDSPDTIRVFAWTRGLGAALAVGVMLLLRWSPAVRRHTTTVILLLGLCVVFLAGWQFSLLGPPKEVWFQWLVPIVFAPIALSLRPMQRVLYGALLAATMVAGYFGRTPSHFSAPLALAVLDWLLFLTIVGIGAGILADGLRRREFFLQRLMQRQAEELRVLSDQLEERVKQRTAEVQRISAHLESTREDERARLARELHDELGQELTSLRYAVELAQSRHSLDPVGTGANLDEIAFLLTRTRLATRELVTLLRPRVLDDLGLAAAAEWLGRRTSERTGIEVSVQVPSRDLAISTDVSTAAFRILQEALTNVARHAKATRADVTLELVEDSLRLSIIDDGAGFDATAETAGFGLLGMNERAYAVGGEVEVDAVPGRGTRVSAKLPSQGRQVAA